MSPPTFTPESLPDLTGRVYLVTGGNSGLGYETVLQLAIHHAKVYIGARSEAKAQAAIESINKDARVSDANVHFLKIDLADLASVVDAAREIQEKEEYLHGLVNNAGIMATAYELTGDGYETQFQVNYLSHWLLTQSLLPILVKTAAADASQSPGGVVRVVNIASHAHHNAPSYGIDLSNVNRGMGWVIGPVRRYGSSKLANILHTRELDRRYRTPEARAAATVPVDGGEVGEVWTASIDPGRVDTNLALRANGNILLSIIASVMSFLEKFFPISITVEEGSRAQLFAIASDQFTGQQSGEYWKSATEIAEKTSKARNGELARELWDWTEKEMREKGLI